MHLNSRFAITGLAMISLLCTPTFANGPDKDTDSEPELLTIGSPAPDLQISEWVQGKEIGELEEGQVYVVEFWATWCGPCITSMPHMAQLQTEYGDKVRFVGISSEDADTVGKFMEKEQSEDKTWAEVLTYAIALDDERVTNQRYMKAAEQSGIPCAFIVGKDRCIEWIGHPMSMDEPLEQIVAGEYDREAAIKEVKKAQQEQKLLQDAMPELQVAMRDGHFGKAVSIMEKLQSEMPESSQFAQIKLSILKSGIRAMTQKLNDAQNQSVEAQWEDAMGLNQIAWDMVSANPPENTKLALKAAKRAVELSEEKDGAILDTYARALFVSGDVQAAIDWQKKAIEAAGEGQMAEDLAEALQEYKAALDQ